MKTGLLATGMIAAGLTGAFLFDPRRGSKRRKLLRRKTRYLAHQASDAIHGCSRDMKPYWKKYSKEFTRGARRFREQGMKSVEGLNHQSNHNGWSPSARFLGATASAMAVYSTGRRGMMGNLLRIMSLGLFTRALLAAK